MKPIMIPSVVAQQIDAPKSISLTLRTPGETEFTGPDAIWYFDVGASWDILENLELRAGLNNVFDTDPASFKPNQQSGTDPSTYDVVGRRAFFQANVKF